jgi:predicted anti-sigma-YlaC factor YlaD
MFSRHVSKRLSAYCNGETSGEESRAIAEHLIACDRCRKEHEEIKLGVTLAAQLPQVVAPEEIWNEVQRLLGEPRRQERGSSGRRSTVRWVPLVAVGAGIVLLVIAGGLFWESYRGCESWAVDAIAGSPKVGSSNVTGSGRIEVGQLLETGNNDSARITVGQIGNVDIDPNSRVRLLEACITEHRIELLKGGLYAKISAPPRLFFVDTPSAEAIDMGCEYRLEVDDAGRSFLHVTLGWVELAGRGMQSFVVRYAMCQTRPGIGPGAPYFEDATREFVSALEKFDFENGGEAALRLVLEHARQRDTMTLWHLLQRVDETQRGEILARMTDLIALPEGVTVEGLMKLDKSMLDFERWMDAMDIIWF